MADVFISYASEDRPRAKAIAETLGAHGWDVWWDRKIPVGGSFHEVIEKAISESNCVVVLWSRHSAGSDWVRNEAEEGKRRGILTPALLEDVKVPLGFRHLQAANLTDWEPSSTHPEFDQLVESITRVLREPPTKAGRDAIHPDAKSSGPTLASRVRPGTGWRKAKTGFLVGALGVVILFCIALAIKWQDRNAVHDLIMKIRESAEEGRADNQYRLAEYYAKGEFVPKDDAEAMKWYRLAAENGYAAAQSYMGNLYAEGRGVRQDDTEATRWFRKAAEQGDVPAQRTLGARYAVGRGIEKDGAAAAQWLRKAAEQGDAQAQTSLGFMYADGKGVPEDDAEALKWWRDAARQGEPMAQKQLKNNGLSW